MRQRREVLQFIAVGSCSGCLVGDDASPRTPPEDRDRPCWQTVEGGKIDEDPLFSVASQEKMVLPKEELPLDYQKVDDQNYPTYDAYINTRTGNRLLFKVKIYADVDGAVNHFNEKRTSFDSPESSTLADQSVKEDNGDQAESVIRMSNAIGSVISYIPEESTDGFQEQTFSPEGLAGGYARELLNYWGGTSDYRKHTGFCREKILKETKAG